MINLFDGIHSIVLYSTSPRMVYNPSEKEGKKSELKVFENTNLESCLYFYCPSKPLLISILRLILDIIF